MAGDARPGAAVFQLVAGARRRRRLRDARGHPIGAHQTAGHLLESPRATPVRRCSPASSTPRRRHRGRDRPGRRGDARPEADARRRPARLVAAGRRGSTRGIRGVTPEPGAFTDARRRAAQGARRAAIAHGAPRLAPGDRAARAGRRARRHRRAIRSSCSTVQPAGKTRDARGRLVARTHRRTTTVFASSRIQPGPRARVAADVLARGARLRRLRQPAAARAHAREAQLDAADAGLATELDLRHAAAAGLLRPRHRARRAADRSSKIDPECSTCCGSARTSCSAMRVAPHAAVDESVALVAAAGKAIGRRVRQRRAAHDVRATPRRPGVQRAARGARRATRRLAVEYSHPRWVVEAFRRALWRRGRAADELDELLAADNVAPAGEPSSRCPGSRTSPSARPEPARSPAGCRRSPRGRPAAIPPQLPVVACGRARVQDEGSQLAALALSRARPDRGGGALARPVRRARAARRRCSPRRRRSGARPCSPTSWFPRAPRLVRNALAVFDAARPRSSRATAAASRAERGAVRPHPARRARAPGSGRCGGGRRRAGASSPATSPSWPRCRRELLDAAVAALAPGGLLAYVTCSPHPAETRVEVVRRRSARHPELRAVDTPAVLADDRRRADLELAAGRHAQLWPHRHGTDAMFIQLLTDARIG